jgi:hypothetical protein
MAKQKIETAATDPSTAREVRFTVEFSLPVNEITGSFYLAGTPAAGAQVTGITTRDHRIYTITMTGMTTSGIVVLSLPEGAAQYRPPTGLVSAASTSTDNRVAVDFLAPTSRQRQRRPQELAFEQRHLRSRPGQRRAGWADRWRR